MKSERVERGVMVMKDGKAWGVKRADGQFTEYGWIDPSRAPIHDPKYCKKPEHVMYKGHPYVKELKTGKITHVVRTTTVETVKP